MSLSKTLLGGSSDIGFKAEESDLFKKLTSTNKELKAERSVIATERIERGLKSFIEKRKEERDGLRSKIQDLLDFGGDSTMSTKVLPANFNAEEFGRSILELKVDLELIDQEIDVHEETYAKIIGVKNYTPRNVRNVTEIVIKCFESILPKEMTKEEDSLSFKEYITKIAQEVIRNTEKTPCKGTDTDNN